MGLFRRRLVERRGTEYRIALEDDERDVLRQLVPQLKDLALHPDEPSTRRLYPVAYPDDPDRDAGYHALARDELVTLRLQKLSLLEATAGLRDLTEAQLFAWMGAINDARLVLGTLLDVQEEDDHLDFDPESDDAPRIALYHWLGWLLDEIVRAVAD